MLRLTFLTPALLACILILPLLAACGSSGAISRTVDDGTISTRVKTALLNDPQVAALRINVQTSGGVVTLTGTVKSQAEEQRAIAVARSIDGVKDVKSQLKIEGVGPTTAPSGSVPAARPAIRACPGFPPSSRPVRTRNTAGASRR